MIISKKVEVSIDITGNAQYIIGYFSPSLRAGQYSAEKTAIESRQAVLKLRREEELNADHARELFDRCSVIEQMETIDSLHRYHDDLMTEIHGDDWWYCVGEEHNPDYKYLERIINAVQEALKQADAILKERKSEQGA